MKKLVLISYSFPPLNSSSAFRFGQLVKYFYSYGWETYVITTNSIGDLEVGIPESNIYRYGAHISGIVKSQESRAKSTSVAKKKGQELIQRVKKTYKLASIDGNTIISRNNCSEWKKEVVSGFSKLEEQMGKPDIILSTCAPATSVDIGNYLRKRFKVPFLIDFRDLHALARGERPNFVYLLDKFIERHKVKKASGFITVSKTLKRILSEAYGKPTITIFNGWDSEASEGSEQIVHYQKASDFPDLRNPYFHYAGVLYEHRIEAIHRFLKALCNYEAEKYCFVFRSLGPEKLNSIVISMVKTLRLDKRVFILKPAKYRTVLREQKEAISNIVFEDISENQEYTKGSLTGKFLQLLPGELPPILFIARSDSEAKSILKKTNKGSLCTTEEEIVRFIQQIRSTKYLNPNYSEINYYSKKNQAKLLCSFFDYILSVFSHANVTTNGQKLTTPSE